jgi:hypothetical protein
MLDKFIAVIIVIWLVFTACGANAQEATSTSTAATTTATTTAPETVTAGDVAETRQQLREVLHRLPPEVGRVLKIDASLWSNKEYVDNYPQLAAFVAQHPEVARNPQFYTRDIWIPLSDAPPENAGTRLWRDMMEGLFVMLGIGATIFVFTWLIRTIISHRRWSRLTRLQAEVHNKLLDRFGSNEEVLRYIDTPAGKKFLEAAPIPLEAEPRPVSAPLSRVLWSIQAGVILGAAGLGLQFVSFRADKDAAAALSSLGILAIALGAGFIVAALISFLVSRRLGLLPGTAAAQGE